MLGYMLLLGYAGPRKPGEGTEDEEQGIISGELTPSGYVRFASHFKALALRRFLCLVFAGQKSKARSFVTSIASCCKLDVLHHIQGETTMSFGGINAALINTRMNITSALLYKI